MGTWGPALFSDDTAEDVRGIYRELIEDGVDHAEATRRVLTEFADAINDPDEGAVVWLALAFTQSKVGRLDSTVSAEAIRAIDEGLGLDRWAEDAKLLARRRAALEKVRQQLVGPQPARKRLRPPKRKITNLVAGDLFVYRTGGVCIPMRVARIKSNRYGDSPIIVLLDYDEPDPPPPDVYPPDRTHGRWRGPGGSEGPWSTAVFEPIAPTPDDLGALEELGFEKIGSRPARPGDDELKMESCGGWPALAVTLDRLVRSAAPPPQPASTDSAQGTARRRRSETGDRRPLDCA